jgi:hypothetical protein
VFATGVVSDLVEKTMRSPDTANSARNLIKSPAMRSRLEIVLGQQEADRIIDQMSRLTRMTETFNEALRGSGTYKRQAAEGTLTGAQQEPGVLRNLFNLRFGDAAAGLIGMNQPRMLTPKIAQSTLGALAARTPDQITAALTELAARGRLRVPGLGVSPVEPLIGGALGAGAGDWGQ